MSATPAADAPVATAESSSLVGIPMCLVCQSAFSALHCGQVPQGFSCGHVACGVCAEEAARLDPPACPVCMKDARHGYSPDYALAAFADQYFAEKPAPAVASDSSLRAPAAAVPSTCELHPSHALSYYCNTDCQPVCEECSLGHHDDHDVVPLQEAVPMLRTRVAEGIAACIAGAKDAMSAQAHVEGSRDRMLARKDASFDRLEAAAAVVKGAVEAHVKATKASVERECKARVKALEAQVEALSVRCNQLMCVAQVCAAAALVPGRDSCLQLAHASRCVHQATPLLVPYRGPCVSTVCEAVPDTGAVLRAVDALSRLQLAIDAQKCIARGSGISGFRASGDNTFQISLRDEAGVGVDGVAPEDVLVDVECRGVASPLKALRVIDKTRGVFNVVYRLREGVSRALLHISACGVSGIAAAPYPLSQLLAGSHWKGIPARIYPACDGKKYGMAANAQHAVVADFTNKCLQVYDVSLGMCSHVQTLAKGAEELYRVCFTPSGNILACSAGGNIVMEWEPTGRHVRNIPSQRPWAIACNTDVIVVGLARATAASINVLDYESGHVLRSFGALGSGNGQIGGQCVGLRITHDGQRVLAVELMNRRISEFTIMGEFVRHVAAGALSDGQKDIDIGPDGELLVSEFMENRVCVFSPDTGALVAQWGRYGDDRGEFRQPTALAVAGRRLYVLDRDTARLQVFE